MKCGANEAKKLHNMTRIPLTTVYDIKNKINSVGNIEIVTIWNRYGPEFYTYFIESMPARLQMCIDAGGETINV